jgi:hypothetical protein
VPATRATLTAARDSRDAPDSRHSPDSTDSMNGAIVLAQAEPAPDDYVPPGHSRPDESEGPPVKPYPKPWLLTLDASLPFTLGTVSPTLPPVGWGASLSIARALLNFGRLRLGIGAQFGYQRLQHEKHSEVVFGDLTQSVADTTFAGMLFADGIFGRVRPWFDIGGGFAVAQYFDPGTDGLQQDVRANAVVPLLQIAAGFGIYITRGIELGLAGHFDLTFSDVDRGEPVDAGKTPTSVHTVFAPGLVSLRLQLGFRF